MSNDCLSKLLEVGIGVKGPQVADQDIMTHVVVNLRKTCYIRDIAPSAGAYVPETCKRAMYFLFLTYISSSLYSTETTTVVTCIHYVFPRSTYIKTGQTCR